jgi:hypothetical protein
MRRSAPLLTSTLLTVALLALACKPSGNEAYAEALKLLGEAERGPCKMTFDGNQNMYLVESSKIAECLERTKEGLVKLEEAKSLGLDTREVDNLILKTEDEVRRLESMQRTVLRMKNDLDAGKP